MPLFEVGLKMRLQLRDYLDRPELAEVVVKREGVLDSKTFHDDVRRAVSKAPHLVDKILENFKGFSAILLTNPFNCCRLSCKQFATSGDRAAVLAASAKKRQKLINHLVSGNEGRLEIGASCHWRQ